VRRLDRGASYPIAVDLAGEAGWTEALEAEGLADALRSSISDEYATASNEQMGDALMEMLDSMSPAEALNFGSALSRIGKSAGQLVADPAFRQVASAALPIAGGLIGGPMGAGLGSLAAGALAGPAAPPPAAARPTPPPPTRTAPAPAPAAAPAPAPSARAIPPPPATPPPGTGLPGSVAGGSQAAKQCLVLTHQRDMLQALLATALGRHGRLQVSGIPVAQLLALLSELFAQAAADADELMYLGGQADAAESAGEDDLADSFRSLYHDLLGADDLEFTEAAGWEGLD
jgi:hypothetical protein